MADRDIYIESQSEKTWIDGLKEILRIARQIEQEAEMAVSYSERQSTER
jgi:hypothetical protein